MFIIWGTRHLEKTLGNSKRPYQCSHCNNVSKYRIFRRRTWFALFWIPTIPLSSKYFIACPICNFGSQISKEEALNQVEEEIPVDMQN